MPSFNELYQSYLNRVEPVAPAAPVANPTEARPVTPEELYLSSVGAVEDKGQAGEDEFARDLRELSPYALRQKYGSSVDRVIGDRVEAGIDYRNDRTSFRTDGESLADTARGLGRGFVGSLGGAAALGFGVLDEDAGTSLSGKLGELDEFIRSFDSAGISNRRRAFEANQTLDQRDSAEQYKTDRVTEGDFVASLKQIGRDTISSVSNAFADPAIVGDVVAEGGGSLLAAGPLIKGGKLVADGAVTLLKKGGLLRSVGAYRRAVKGADLAAGMAGIGGLEAGGAYTDAVSQVMSLSHDDLMETSEDYRELIASGMSPREARQELASATGIYAAALTFPAAAAIGTTVAKFEANPIASVTARRAVQNTLTETAEEALQGGAAGLAGNLALQDNVDPNQSLAEGVGTQVGLGAIGGFGAGGIIQAPGIARDSVVAAGKLTLRGAKAAVDGVALAAEKIEEANEAASKVSNSVVAGVFGSAAQRTAEAREAANTDPAVAALNEEERATVLNHTDELARAVEFDPTELPENTPDFIRGALEKSTDRFDVIQRLSRLVEQAEEGSVEQLQAAALLQQELQQHGDLIRNKLEEAVDSLPEDSPTRSAIEGFSNILALSGQTPVAKKAIDRWSGILKEAQEKGALSAVTESELETPEGRRKVQNTVTAAETAPDALDPEIAESVLQHNEAGRLELTPAQVGAIKASLRLVRGQQRRLEILEQAGVKSPANIVAENVTVTDEGKRLSVNGHLRRIVGAVRMGDQKTAKAYLQDLVDFAQHMQNKVEATNKHLALGTGNKEDAVPYQGKIPGQSRWVEMPGRWVNPAAPRTVQQAQAVWADAQLVAEVANQVVESFPELGLRPVSLVELDSTIQGDPRQVAKDFRERGREAESETEVESTPEETSPATAENVVEETPAPATEEAPAQGELDLEPVVEEEAAPEPVSRVTPEQASTLSDPDLNDRMVAIEDKFRAGEATPEDQKTYSVLDNEYNARIESAREAALAEEAEEAELETTEQEAPESAPAEEVVPAEESDATSTGALPETALEEPADWKDNLLSGEKIVNWFKKAFTFSGPTAERFDYTESPVATVKDSLESAIASPDVVSAYEEVLTLVDAWKRSLNKELRDFMKGLTAKQRQLFEDGILNRFAEGKILNITEESNGTLRLNDRLMEAAGLAGIQWLLEASNLRQNMDEEKLAALLKADESAITPDLVEMFNAGMSLDQATTSLALHIKQFWGVRNDPTAPEGMSQGIVEQLAKQLIQQMIQQGFFQITQPAKERFANDVIVLVQDRIRLSDNLKKQPRLLAEFWAPEAPNLGASVGGPVSNPIAKTQLRNRNVELTNKQRAAIRRKRQVPFFVNVPMAHLYAQLGKAGVLELFGGGDIDNKPLNAQHKLTLAGRNQTLGGAYDSMVELVLQAEGQSETSENMAIEDVPIHYDFTFTSVNRMQMLGANNPQASKLMREGVLPTKATINLADPETFLQWKVAIAQHLGVKVHQKTVEAIEQEVDALLGGEMAPAIAAMVEWVSGGYQALPEDFVGTLSESLGGENTPAAAHALLDYARYLADPASAGSFATSLYLEADGVTNGPVNAMNIFTPGEFTAAQIAKLSKGGLFLNRQGTTMNENFNGDLYMETSQFLDTIFGDTLAGLEEGSPLRRQTERLLWLMEFVLGKDVTFDGKEVQFDRGIAKNPLTVTLYGAGAKGIANKITSAIVTGVAEKLTQAAANPDVSMAEALFPNDVNAEEKAQLLGDALNVLARSFIFKDKKTGETKVLADKKVPAFKINPVTFQFTEAQLKNIQGNINELFVGPMRESIFKTAGSELMGALTDIRMAVQVQSVFYKNAFKKAIEAKLEEKAQEENWNKSMFLSRKELSEIHESVKHLAPAYSTGDQNFLILKESTGEFKDVVFSRTLDKQFKTQAGIRLPENAGVKGIPAMVISTGDGQMIQNFIENAENGGVTLDVFDGINLPIDKIAELGEVANRSAYEAWTANPTKDLAKAFEAFLPSAIQGMEKDFTSNEVIELAMALDIEVESALDVMRALTDLSDSLNRNAQEIEARHNVMKRTKLSVDQMASARAPYLQDGDIDLSGLTDEEAAAVLNEAYLEELDKVRGNLEEGEGQEDVSEALNALAPEEDGLRQLSANQLGELIRRENIPGWHKRLLRDIAESLAADGYTVIMGTDRRLRDWAVKNKVVLGNKGAKGYTLPDRKLILLNTASSETVVHELIHAASFAVIAAYYAGEALSDVQKGAVERLESLMEQFLELDVSSEGNDTRNAYNAATAAITEHLLAGRQAEALNEFMAWGMANQDLAKLQSKQKVNPLAKLARDVIEAIKKLLWGDRRMSAVSDDMLSNVQFNTNILMNAPFDVRTEFNQTVLYQAPGYGNDARLVNFNRIIGSSLVKHLKRNAKGENPRAVSRQANTAVRKLLRQGAQVTQLVQTGFSFNPQQRTTFDLIAAAMSSSLQLDPNAMSKIADLYEHVVGQLEVEDFMRDPDSNADPNDRYFAQKKYDVLVGNTGFRLDDQGRSSLLTAFVGLAVVDPQFRQILSGMQMPALQRNQDGSVDALVENAGRDVMDWLGNRISYGKNKPQDVQIAFEYLMDRVLKTAIDRQTTLDQVSQKTGSFVDRLNELTTEGMSRFAQKTEAASKKVADNTNNPAVKAGAQALRVMSALADQDTAEAVSEGALSWIARQEGKNWNPITRLMTDLIGRTKNTAQVYDLIKEVRSRVQQIRQQFRTEVPAVIERKFTGKLSEKQWADLYKGMGKTDLAALKQDYSEAQILAMVQDPTRVDQEIAKLEEEIQGLDTDHWQKVLDKAKQLAHFMNTGETGSNLLRNHFAVADLLGERGVDRNRRTVPARTYEAVDQLITLYAFQGLAPDVKASVVDLATNEAEGFSFSLSYLIGQRKDENQKLTGMALYNGYKGYIPNQTREGETLLVASESRAAELLGMSFTRVGEYGGSNLERGADHKSYWYAPVSARAAHNQGLVQLVQRTANGVDASTGMTHGISVAGAITNGAEVEQIYRRRGRETGAELLMPIYDADGNISAYERSVDPQQLARIQEEQHLGKAIGIWRGRQVEEHNGEDANQKVLAALRDMYEKEIAERPDAKREYVNLFEDTQDPVIEDAMSIIPEHTMRAIRGYFPDGFYVRRDMLDDAIGYRNASVRNIWDGNTRWGRGVQKVAKDVVVATFGNKAFKYVVNAEEILQNLIADARTTIVVRSVIVPAVNLTANVYQLWARGVPAQAIAKGFPKKTAEIDFYLSSRARKIDAEAELRASSGNAVQARRLRAEIRAIDDKHRRLSIWPLIEAGEFTSITDGAVTPEDLALGKGKLSDYMERLADRLPEGAQQVARYGLITRDTPLYKGLQRSIEYGDFIAKAVLFDYLTKDQGKSQDDARAAVTEEFVNYDRLPGRFRGYAENIGLLWFWNFKLRSVKVATGLLRNNPVHTFLSLSAPAPTLFGTVGSPVEDNFVSTFFDGRLDYSVGPDMAIRAPFLNPWVNAVN